MLAEMNTITTKSYYIGHDFYIDIIKNIMTNYYEAWIWNESYGIKNHMFSVPMEQQPYNEFLKIVENNLEEYMNSYKEDYMNKEVI